MPALASSTRRQVVVIVVCERNYKKGICYAAESLQVQTIGVCKYCYRDECSYDFVRIPPALMPTITEMPDWLPLVIAAFHASSFLLALDSLSRASSFNPMHASTLQVAQFSATSLEFKGQTSSAKIIIQN